MITIASFPFRIGYQAPFHFASRSGTMKRESTGFSMILCNYIALLTIILAVFVSQGWCAESKTLPRLVTPAHIPVLMYHKVSTNLADEPDHTLIHLFRFEEQMKYLADNGYTTVDLYDLKEYMEGKLSLPDKSVVITFDDGWKTIQNALPVLKKHKLKATFFIVLEYVENAYPAFVTWPELSEIAANRDFEVGCHSSTHPWVPGNNLVSWIEGKTPNRSRNDVLAEIAGAKKTMEERLQRPIVHYAWPSGWYNEELLAIARDSGFITTVTTDLGLNRPGMSPLKIHRYPVYGLFSLEQFKQLLTRNFTDMTPLLGSSPSKKITIHDYPARQ
jgi:peptidoglycan/xylan/chitin deacetylase (PgdA/CDA1 family)